MKAEAVTKRILVVDDEVGICAFLSEVLQGAGMKVDTATTAEEAMDLFGRNRYDLLTLDCYMPGTSGVALHQTLSRVYGFGKRLPSSMPQRLPPVLVITGYAQEPDVRELVFGERIVGVIQKPVTSQELLRVVTEVLDWEETRNSRRNKALVRLGARVSKRGQEVIEKQPD